MPVLVIVLIIGLTAMAVLIIRKSNRPRAGRRRREPTSDWSDDSRVGAAVLTTSDLFTTHEPIPGLAASDAGHADLSQDSVEACDVGSGSDTGSSSDDSSSSSSD